MKARVLLAMMAIGETDVILLDEPTNHVDFSVSEMLAASLQDFNGTLVVVSHDRKFLEEVSIHTLIELTDGRIKSNTLLASTL
jgi:ATP-binding cassette, subfamily F, member 3